MDLFDNCGLTLVGTLRANKKEVPDVMKDVTSRELGSTAFLYTDKMTLVSQVTKSSKKKKKIVLLLSSMHSIGSIGASGKPEVIEFYNSTKGGVDTLDQMCALYSCGRSTQRWPSCIFYGMVNVATINSWIIHRENTNSSVTRRKFMQEIANSFIKPWAQQRLSHPNISISLRNTIIAICNVAVDRSQRVIMAESNFPPTYCKKCPAKKRRKTRFHCTNCDFAVCLSHCYSLCVDCDAK